MTKLYTNGTTTLKTKKSKQEKYRDKIWFEKSMLLASLPALYDEVSMLENFVSKEELKQLKSLLVNHEFLLNKK